MECAQLMFSLNRYSMYKVGVQCRPLATMPVGYSESLTYHYMPIVQAIGTMILLNELEC